MKTIPDTTNSPGAWVRLCHGEATVALQRWPGPHCPGSAIVDSDGHRYLYAGIDPSAQGGPEVIYRRPDPEANRAGAAGEGGSAGPWSPPRRGCVRTSST